MSIFPRKICNGEYVIFHMGFKGILDNNKKVGYYLKLYNPRKKIIMNIKDNIYIRGNNKIYEKNIYYPILIDNGFIPGRYYIEFYLICDGKKVYSSTKDTDNFVVEKISYSFKKYNNKNIVVLKNESNGKTNINLYLEGNKKIKKELLLNSFEEKKIITKCSKAYIEYGNNNFIKIN